MSDQQPPQRIEIPSTVSCIEKARLLKDFLQAVRELNAILAQQTQAVIEGDEDFARFDILMHFAEENKNRAKYAWMTHIEKHRCQDGGTA